MSLWATNNKPGFIIYSSGFIFVFLLYRYSLSAFALTVST